MVAFALRCTAIAFCAVAVFGKLSAATHSKYTLAALAIEALPSISTVPFNGPYRHYRGYLSDSADPDVLAAYKRAVHDGTPKSVLISNAWMMPFAGVTAPSELLSFQKRKYLWASSCRPHDCLDAHIYIVYDPVRKCAWGAAHSDSNVYVFGSPSHSQEALLLDLIARSFFSYDEPFPLSGSTTVKVKSVLRASKGRVETLVASHSVSVSPSKPGYHSLRRRS